MKAYQCFLLLLVKDTAAFLPYFDQVKFQHVLAKDTPVSKLQASVIYDCDKDSDLIAVEMAEEHQHSSNALPLPDSDRNVVEPQSDKHHLTLEALFENKEAVMESIAAKVAPEIPRVPQPPKHPNFGDALNDDIAHLPAQAAKLLEEKSRPQRKPVSLHSTVSMIAAGSYLTAYLPFFHPGLDHDGFLQIFDFYQPLSIEACHQIQLGVNMLALSGIMGYFRIPPKAPATRRLPFTLAAFANVLFALTLSSSLNALPEGYWSFDAFSGFGVGAIAAAYFGTSASMISSLDNAISGPEHGLQTTPGAMNRGMNIMFVTLIFFFVNGAQIPLVAPIFFSDLDTYQQSMSTAFESVGMAALDFHSFGTAVGFVSFLSLVATLQFEKKISETAGMVSMLSLFFVFNLDAIVATYKTMVCPDLLPVLESSNFYLFNMITEHNLMEGAAAITGLVLLSSLTRLLTGAGLETTKKSKRPSVVPVLMMKD
ncbi:MAG: hypothetical protein SGBAC_003172 [Bacillariaceae sp.]